jgi:hypothetical protein
VESDELHDGFARPWKRGLNGLKNREKKRKPKVVIMWYKPTQTAYNGLGNTSNGNGNIKIYCFSIAGMCHGQNR